MTFKSGDLFFKRAAKHTKSKIPAVLKKLGFTFTPKLADRTSAKTSLLLQLLSTGRVITGVVVRSDCVEIVDCRKLKFLFIVLFGSKLVVEE